MFGLVLHSSIDGTRTRTTCGCTPKTFCWLVGAQGISFAGYHIAVASWLPSHALSLLIVSAVQNVHVHGRHRCTALLQMHCTADDAAGKESRRTIACTAQCGRMQNYRAGNPLQYAA